MKIYVFGNTDLDCDSLPFRILPQLKKKFPNIEFHVKDPNEEWNINENFIILDTVHGIKDVKVFDDLDSFKPPPRITMHDFDAYSNLKMLKKLGKLPKIKIIGIPPEITKEEAFEKVSFILQ